MTVEKQYISRVMAMILLFIRRKIKKIIIIRQIWPF
jgi:hypothetical protein